MAAADNIQTNKTLKAVFVIKDFLCMMLRVCSTTLVRYQLANGYKVETLFGETRQLPLK